ncbi:unnamed protein product [Caenorhabditis sp. 36 PRJEB53466]|nr:unnamed protein product [Caenorhabditis sp. 36 PRJEB53466]
MNETENNTISFVHTFRCEASKVRHMMPKQFVTCHEYQLINWHVQIAENGGIPSFIQSILGTARQRPVHQITLYPAGQRECHPPVRKVDFTLKTFLNGVDLLPALFYSHPAGYPSRMNAFNSGYCTPENGEINERFVAHMESRSGRVEFEVQTLIVFDVQDFLSVKYLNQVTAKAMPTELNFRFNLLTNQSTHNFTLLTAAGLCFPCNKEALYVASPFFRKHLTPEMSTFQLEVELLEAVEVIITWLLSETYHPPVQMSPQLAGEIMKLAERLLPRSPLKKHLSGSIERHCFEEVGKNREDVKHAKQMLLVAHTHHLASLLEACHATIITYHYLDFIRDMDQNTDPEFTQISAISRSSPLSRLIENYQKSLRVQSYARKIAWKTTSIFIHFYTFNYFSTFHIKQSKNLHNMNESDRDTVSFVHTFRIPATEIRHMMPKQFVTCHEYQLINWQFTESGSRRPFPGISADPDSITYVIAIYPAGQRESYPPVHKIHFRLKIIAKGNEMIHPKVCFTHPGGLPPRNIFNAGYCSPETGAFPVAISRCLDSNRPERITFEVQTRIVFDVDDFLDMKYLNRSVAAVMPVQNNFRFNLLTNQSTHNFTLLTAAGLCFPCNKEALYVASPFFRKHLTPEMNFFRLDVEHLETIDVIITWLLTETYHPPDKMTPELAEEIVKMFERIVPRIPHQRHLLGSIERHCFDELIENREDVQYVKHVMLIANNNRLGSLLEACHAVLISYHFFDFMRDMKMSPDPALTRPLGVIRSSAMTYLTENYKKSLFVTRFVKKSLY